MKVRKINIDDLSKFNGVNKELSDDMKRQLREPLLKAFDIYKSNVFYKIAGETEGDRLSALGWYADLLNLKESAFVHIPPKIKRYL